MQPAVIRDSWRRVCVLLLVTALLLASGCGDDDASTRDPDILDTMTLPDATPDATPGDAEETSAPGVCGDGALDAGEACDDGNTTDGDGCSSACQVEASPGCGDGTLDAGEACDDGNTTSGDGCSSACEIEPPAGPCGDGVLEPGEACDDGNTTSGDGCSSVCAQEAPSICGDGQITARELCDRGDLGGATCESEGFLGGTLRCNKRCVYDTRDCVSGARCGDGVALGGEVCDGSDLQGTRCVDLGFASGRLDCTRSCVFDTDACISAGAYCGDDTTDANESCDGVDLDGATCATQGDHDGGVLTCTRECAFDTRGCSLCGDGKATGREPCDGGDLGGATCLSLGFAAGPLACDSACQFDASMCEPFTTGSCAGDGIDAGEACDGADLGGATCRGLGLPDGTLSCDATCALDTSGCVGVCGDGVLDDGEACDGADLGGATCVDLGSPDGTLRCDSNCAFDTRDCRDRAEPPVEWTCAPGWWDETDDHCDCGCGALDPDCADATAASCDACGGPGSCALDGDCGALLTDDNAHCIPPDPCGDGVIEADEECDGADLGGATCVDLGLPDGALSCAGCVLDTSGCDGNGEAPVEWTCAPGWWRDDACDCGCGVPDIDCGGDAAATACDYCLGPCTGDARCAAIDPMDNSQCIGACGDSVVDPGEGCDDGNLADGDGCSASCSPEARCGDAAVDPGEDCDDGNAVGGDGCSARCEVESTSPPEGWTCTPGWWGDERCDCGCGVVDVDCASAAAAACDHCHGPCAEGRCARIASDDNSQCEADSTCGDGVVDPDEGCDDGNTTSGDGCSASCSAEGAPDAWTCAPAWWSDGDCDCGCGVVDVDCGADVTRDACDTCLGPCVEGGGCAAIAPMDSSQCGGDGGEVCGDGALDTGEACDDGNVINGDGCSAACTSEGPPVDWTCHGVWWGDGDCDCGCGVVDIDCSSPLGEACQHNQCPTRLLPEPDDNATCGLGVCGDGIESGWESCDDGNTVSGDGCASFCALEQSDPPQTWSCDPEWWGDDACDCGCGAVDVDCPDVLATSCQYDSCPEGQHPEVNNNSACAAEGVCGDGLRQAGEQCDDGNTTGGDGCSATCSSEQDTPPADWACEAGWWRDGRCDCGCAVIDIDCGGDPGVSACDACAGPCAAGEGCSVIDPLDNSQCVAEGVCGDGVLDAGEQCDDGNLEDGDGCSASCVDESNTAPPEWVCDPSWWEDGVACDCGCGAVDPDCASADPSECTYCSGCAAGDCEALDPMDSSRCQ